MAAQTRPFAAFEWMIALRYLRARRQEGFVSVISGFSLIGIALGVATLIIVMSVMNGFRHELLSRILGLNGHAVVQSYEGNLTGFDAAAARVRAVPGVTRAAPIIDGQVMATSRRYFRGRHRARHAQGRSANRSPRFRDSLSDGALARYDGGDSVIVGARLADKLGLRPGMTITLIAPKGNITPFGTTPRVKTYTIAGTFRIGMSEYDQTFIFMPLDEAQLYFNMDNAVSGLEVMVADPDQINAMIPADRARGGPAFARADMAGHELKPVRRAGSRAQCDVPDPHAHHIWWQRSTSFPASSCW